MSESIRASVGSVLRNVSNYPRGVQARVVGQDLEPLIHKVTQAVLRALAAHDAEVRARALVQGFSEGVNFIDNQPGPWGACMVAGRAEAARRRAEAEGAVDL